MDITNIFQRFDSHFYQNSASNLILTEPQNVIISPFSILFAVTLAMMGAREKTEKNMKHVLEYNEKSNEEILLDFKNITDIIEMDGTVKIANKLFVSSRISLNKTYQENAVTYFKSEVDNIDYSNVMDALHTINSWVESKTNNKIKNILKRTDLTPPPTLILINAIHFQGEWEKQFKESNTVSREFWVSNDNTVETMFMTQQEIHMYADYKDVHIVKLNYKKSNMAMVLLVPKERESIERLENILHENSVEYMLKRKRRQTVNLTMPKFKIEFEIDAKRALQKMGMEDVFSSEANLSGMFDGTTNAHIEKIIHKAFIEVNEKGTEAGAATVVKVGLGSMMGRPPLVDVLVDRPFMFCLYNKQIKSCVFTGKYLFPSQ